MNQHKLLSECSELVELTAKLSGRNNFSNRKVSRRMSCAGRKAVDKMAEIFLHRFIEREEAKSKNKVSFKWK